MTYVVSHRDGTIQATPLGVRLSNVFVSYATYLIQLVYPAKLAGLLPVSPTRTLADSRGCHYSPSHLGSSAQVAHRPYLLVGWFLVSWHSGAGHRAGPSRRPISRGSLYLHSVDRHLHHARLGADGTSRKSGIERPLCWLALRLPPAPVGLR